MPVEGRLGRLTLDTHQHTLPKMENNTQNLPAAHLGVLFVSDEKRQSLIEKFGFDPEEKNRLEQLIGRGWSTSHVKMSQLKFGFDIARRPPSRVPGRTPPPQPRGSKVNSEPFQRALTELRRIVAQKKMSDGLNSQDVKRAIRERIWYFGLDLQTVTLPPRMDRSEWLALKEISNCIALAVELQECSQFVLALKYAHALICDISPKIRACMHRLAIANAKILDERAQRCRSTQNKQSVAKPPYKARRTSRRHSPRRCQFV